MMMFEPEFRSIEEELMKARSKFPPFNSSHEGYAVIKEEVDELWEAVRFGNAIQARKEAMQVAAMAIRFMLDCVPSRQHMFKPGSEGSL